MNKVRELKLLSSSSFHHGLSATSPDINQYDMEIAHESVTFLYRVLANSHIAESYNKAICLFLEAGIKRFTADFALVTRPLSSQVYEVVACVGNDEKFFVGQHLSLSGTLCEQVIAKNETCVHSNLPDQRVHSLSMAYNNTQVGAYLGTVVNSTHAERAVLCFMKAQSLGADTGDGSSSGGYSSEDVAFLELLAEGVAFMTDQQLAQAQRKLTDQAMFALGSVKTLDEYLEQARLPEVFGVPARVVEVLERRISRAPLSIGHIAEELNLSKRTLQRRLQQQDVSFADLRDQVRFHYSIDYLIKQHLSIDSISASLDFSDRTSFTNAFKRWTGLSPSTFRKLFRDYV
ncbi:helix-turn-helix domain-containing protein [Teredinibacter haidensis]|uniref:helix-turn-helix domain-containing protein n=1 Tax=Teredinibacter haidensis TaxID=2731755 RepID=UPI000B310CC5|nr:AraC family transcriptional regulator [Teredinibacter haidensis]